MTLGMPFWYRLDDSLINQSIYEREKCFLVVHLTKIPFAKGEVIMSFFPPVDWEVTSLPLPISPSTTLLVHPLGIGPNINFRVQLKTRSGIFRIRSSLDVHVTSRIWYTNCTSPIRALTSSMRGCSAEFRVLKSMIAWFLERVVELLYYVRAVLCEVKISNFYWNRVGLYKVVFTFWVWFYSWALVCF